MKTVFLGSDLDPNDPQANEERLAHICKGSAEAKEFLLAYTAFSHVLDDLTDGVKVGPELTVATLMNFIAQLMFNPWVARHGGGLYSEMLRGTSSWCDSEIALQHSDDRIRQAAQVLKSSHADLAFLAANYIGGHAHMRECSAKWRTFDFDETPTEPDK